MSQQGENTSQRRIVEISFTASGFTHIADYTLLFSLKQKRFVKPVLEKHLRVYYKVYEGYYLELSRRGYSDAPVYVRKVHLYYDGEGHLKEDVLAEAKWEKLEGWDEDNQCPEIIKDFIKAEPGYHRYPTIDYTKVYPEQEVERILKGGVCGHAEE